MKKYCIIIKTPYGSLIIDDIISENENTAFEKAITLASIEINNNAKLDEYHEYTN
jgi:hypothetical protein